MNEKITLQDLVELLSEKNGMTKKNADAFLNFERSFREVHEWAVSITLCRSSRNSP